MRPFRVWFSLLAVVQALVFMWCTGCGRGGPAAGGEPLGVSKEAVSTATLTSVQVTPATASIPALVAQKYTATGIYSDGSKKTCWPKGRVVGQRPHDRHDGTRRAS